MIELIKSILLVLLLIYSVIMTVLYWIDKNNSENFQKDKENRLNSREMDLNKRENIVIDKEICFRELTKLTTVQNAVLEILKSYSKNLQPSIKTNQTDVPVSQNSQNSQ